jgi:hypothetical protein
MTQTVVVFVPGIMGTTLTAPHNLQSVWPDQVGENPGNAFDLLTQSDIQTGYVLQWITTKHDIYGQLVDTFISKGYKAVNSDSLSSTSDNVLVLCGYDWRVTNADSAATVDATLRNVAATYSGATIWLLAHSMGGIVSRYLIESGAFANPTYTLAGLITIATPHLGVPLALSAITGEVNTNDLLNPQIIEELVDYPPFTSAFELLPPSAPFVFDSAGNSYSVWDSTSPVYALLTNPQSGFDAPSESFTEAQAFLQKLDYGSAQNGRPDYYLVYGSGLSTVESFLYDPNGGSPTADLAQQDSTANGGGDGTVPMTSASFQNGWSTATMNGGALTHGELPNDTNVLNQVLSWIG